MINELFFLFLKITAVYFTLIYFIYGALVFFSWRNIRQQQKLQLTQSDQELPPVSFIVPAYNEESLIVETIQTYLSLDLKKEIIVIDDGSHDSTMKLLKVMYQLRQIGTGPFRSITHPELLVLSASHMGKAQALNYGVSHASYEIICTMDADTVPNAQGVRTCLESFTQDPKLLSAGGIIQVLSGPRLQNNTPVSEKPSTWTTSFQRVEYLRTFLCERLGWSFLDSTLLISGAFCMVKKEALKAVGGFRFNSITEDFDLILRLRRHFHGHHFKVLPVTTCYTQVPRTLTHLMHQRMRWQMGLVDSLSKNVSMLFNPKYGLVGLFALPYYWLVELLSPAIEFATLLLLPLALYLGYVDWEMAMALLMAGVSINVFLSFIGVWMEEKHVSTKRNWSYPALLIYSTLMHFGYKQLNSWWRLLALVKVIRKNKSWGEKPREEILVIRA